MDNNIQKEPKNIFSRIWSSFANRVSIYIILILIGIFLLMGVAMSFNIRNEMEKNLVANSSQKLDFFNQQVNMIQKDVASSVDMLTDALTKDIESGRNSEENLNQHIRTITEKHDFIKASYISLEKGYAPGKKDYCQRVVKSFDGQYSYKQLASKSFNYYNMDWYLLPKMLKQSYWSAPHIDGEVSSNLITTFSTPLTGNNGAFIGIISCDVDFSYFTKCFNYDSLNLAYCLIAGEDGTIYHHPNENTILKETLYTLCKNENSHTWEIIGTNMTAGRAGKATYGSGKEKRHVFYGPLKGLNWSAAIVYSNELIQEATFKAARNIFLEGLIITILLYFLVKTTISRFARPIVQMAQAADKMAVGEFHTALPNIHSLDELKMLRSALLNMQDSLSSFISQIQRNSAWQQRIDHEMDMASNIQLNMLPQITPAILENPSIDLYAELHPARMVGGDLYDFYLIKNHLFLVIADVSGKGFPAALLMVETRSMLRSMIFTEPNPAELLKNLNNAIMETNNAEMFVTMFIGVLDLDNGNFSYSNAGHNAPLILHRNGTLDELNVDSNLPLGNFEDITFTQQYAKIAPGDLIFLYTDGISEAEDENHNLYGIKNIKKSLKKCAKLDARNTIELVANDMSKHVGPALQNDDITSLALRYHTPECPKNETYMLTMQRIEDLDKLTAILEEIAEKYDIPTSTLLSINLAIEEIVVNVVLYAHPGESGKHPFDVTIKMANNEIEFSVTDDGVNFDPTSAPEVDTNLPLEQRRIGGLGIHLARQIMDEMEYKRLNKSNILRMRKKL